MEVTITYETPRVIADLVESTRSQNFISALLRSTLVRFARCVEGEVEAAESSGS